MRTFTHTIATKFVQCNDEEISFPLTHAHWSLYNTQSAIQRCAAFGFQPLFSYLKWSCGICYMNKILCTIYSSLTSSVAMCQNHNERNRLDSGKYNNKEKLLNQQLCEHKFEIEKKNVWKIDPRLDFVEK